MLHHKTLKPGRKGVKYEQLSVFLTDRTPARHKNAIPRMSRMPKIKTNLSQQVKDTTNKGPPAGGGWGLLIILGK